MGGMLVRQLGLKLTTQLLMLLEDCLCQEAHIGGWRVGLGALGVSRG